jgi:hypothetical protein
MWLPPGDIFISVPTFSFKSYKNNETGIQRENMPCGEEECGAVLKGVGNGYGGYRPSPRLRVYPVSQRQAVEKGRGQIDHFDHDMIRLVIERGEEQRDLADKAHASFHVGLSATIVMAVRADMLRGSPRTQHRPPPLSCSGLQACRC